MVIIQYTRTDVMNIIYINEYRCDGDLVLDNNCDYGKLQEGELHLVNMNSTSLDYACQKPEPCRTSFIVGDSANQKSFSGYVERKTNNSLVVKINSNDLPTKLPTKVSVHFEYAHWKFKRLHCAIDYAQPQLIKRLVEPVHVAFEDYPRDILKLDQIDQEYQPLVLKKIFKGEKGYPFLLLGPFGTGKTHLLKIATLTLENAGGRILICTHHNRGADTITKQLYSETGYSQKVLRLYPNISEASKEHTFFSASVLDLKVSQFDPYSILVTTFTTAIKLSEQQDICNELQLSHIIIDEGAQSTEPEALGALLLARPDTYLIVAGDNKQVCMFFYNVIE